MPRFLVTYRVTGRITDYIEADSKEHAEELVLAKASSDEHEEAFLDLEEANDIDWDISQMHKVVRDGNVIHTTYVRETDELVA